MTMLSGKVRGHGADTVVLPRQKTFLLCFDKQAPVGVLIVQITNMKDTFAV